MNNLIFREATQNDIPFLIDCIIEAEKSGTDKLAYSTLFNLSEDKVRKYIENMLCEEVDDCELSISSFLLLEIDGHVAGGVSGWIEGFNGIPSSILKGNLLNYTLPQESLQNAIAHGRMLHDLHIDYENQSIQLGNANVKKEYRGNGFLGLLMLKKIEILSNLGLEIKSAYSQIFHCNLPSIKTCEKIGFTQFGLKITSDIQALDFLPDNRKILMKKDLILM